MKKRTKKQQYKHNKIKARVVKDIAPIIFWVCIGLAIMFLIAALANAFGNIAEIVNKLDTKIYTGEQLKENYQYLVEKYGEWTIGNGGAGFEITFVNIKNAVFSGVMILSLSLFVVFFVSAFVLGRWIIPKMAEQIKEDNQDAVNLEILEMAEKNNCQKE